MANEIWNQAFCDRGKNPITMEMKVVLFLYLMTREADYGWNIAAKFKEAIEAKKWTNRRGFGDLKWENKVEAALKQMEQLGLIFKYSDLKKQIPQSFFSNSTIETQVRNNPRRNYYSVNPAVFIDISIETKVDLFYDGTVPQWDVITHSLRFLQDYRKNELEVIELINNISKFDYLTILISMSNIWESSNIHHPVHKKTGAYYKTEISRSFFNNEKKFKRLLDNYSDGRVFNKFWQFHSEFKKSIEEMILREVFFERGYQKIT